MENSSVKRHMQNSMLPQQQRPEKASLATLGMRIRKSVAEGYSLGGTHLSYDPKFFDRQSIPEPQSRPCFERVTLPNGMGAPPLLCNDGSTFQSSLNVAEWASPSVNISVLPFSSGTKRKREDDMDAESKLNFQVPCLVHFPSYDEFRAGNGQLSFNEEF